MEATLWRIKAYGAWVAGCIAVLVAALHGFDLIDYYISSITLTTIAANAYVVVLSSLVVGFAAYRQYITIRKEKYANITSIIHQLFHQLRDLHTYILFHEPRGRSPQEYGPYIGNCKMMFGRIMDQLNNVFSSITSTHCRASIKCLYGANPIYVYTLARDQGSRQKCLAIDNRRVRDNHDPLSDNLQFARLFSENEEVWHFISNDLTCDENFRVTSITAYSPEYATKAPALPNRWNLLARFRRAWPTWPLPYKSTIACVIRQGPFDLDQRFPSEVLGFLTIDSESRGVFEERWDVQIMFAVADALYHPLRAFLDAQNRAENVTQITHQGN
jgi:hypothetical protein